ncbi:hypothetical protein [Pantoea agglomerans]|uniref:hypothetical protein n=1 Tax=Enterobacter agglomerans TaxID=549 RepID=UPI00045C8AFA|nr:hypothetical protein [Pantoea agglomerans]KDA94724.1 hypothetical protein T296_09245 [Pantoea agglomerans Eh318]
MIIISHRGYWKEIPEKNQIQAFERSFRLGYGTETDVRDYNGNLVISHDIPDENCLKFEDFLDIYISEKTEGLLPLALNIKSDGLQKKIKELLLLKNIEDYFVFDMSVPDTIGYRNENINYFVRYSEFESLNSLYDNANGVWLDGFEKDLVEENLIEKFLNDNKFVCLVSSELHKRPHRELWSSLKSYNKSVLENSKLILCTDLPEDAMEFFYGK